MGMTRHKTLSTFKDLVFRMARSEGNVIFIVIFSLEGSAFSHFWELFPACFISSPDSTILSTPHLKSQKLSKDKSILIKKQDRPYSTIIWAHLQDPTEPSMSYSPLSSQLRLLIRPSHSLNMVPILTKTRWKVWILMLPKMMRECLIYWASPKRDQEDIDLIKKIFTSLKFIQYSINQINQAVKEHSRHLIHSSPGLPHDLCGLHLTNFIGLATNSSLNHFHHYFLPDGILFMLHFLLLQQFYPASLYELNLSFTVPQY